MCLCEILSQDYFFIPVTLFPKLRINFLQGSFSSLLPAFMTEKDYNLCVNVYADNVFRFIVKSLRHEEDARDVVQTAFEKLWRNRESVDNDKCKSYLFTVAYNQIIS